MAPLTTVKVTSEVNTAKKTMAVHRCFAGSGFISSMADAA
jgi:hypothetical protein